MHYRNLLLDIRQSYFDRDSALFNTRLALSWWLNTVRVGLGRLNLRGLGFTLANAE